MLLEGETVAGDAVEVVARFTSAQLPVEGLVREAFGALLAADLGLPVPACCSVTVAPDFVAALEQDWSERDAPLVRISKRCPRGWVLSGGPDRATSELRKERTRMNAGSATDREVTIEQ